MSNIVIFTSESVYSCALLNDLFTRCHEDINLIYISKSLKRQKFHKFIINKVIHGLGFRYYMQRVFHDIMHKHKKKSVINLANKYNIPTRYTSNINDQETINSIQAERPDIILSIHYDQIIKKDVLKIPSFGILNVHMSMLPKYRGVKPIFWVLKNNEPKTGITIHMMDEGIDTGDIIAQTEVDISPNDTVDSLTLKVSEIGSKMLLSTIDKIESNSYKLKKQDISCGTYYSQPTRKDLFQFYKQSKKFY